MRVSHENQKMYVSAVKRVLALHPESTNIDVQRRLAEKGLRFEIHYVGKLVKKAINERLYRAEHRPMNGKKIIEGFMAIMEQLRETAIEKALNPNLSPTEQAMFMREARAQTTATLTMLVKSGYLDQVSQMTPEQEERLRDQYPVSPEIRKRWHAIMKNWGYIDQVEGRKPIPGYDDVRKETTTEKPRDVDWAWERKNGLIRPKPEEVVATPPPDDWAWERMNGLVA